MPSSNAKPPDAAYVPFTSSGSSSSLREADEATEYAEALGASSPLLDLVDALFELRTRGFVVRQVRFIIGNSVILQRAAGASKELKWHVPH